MENRDISFSTFFILNFYVLFYVFIFYEVFSWHILSHAYFNLINHNP